jgi:hypothetical protein
MITTAHISGKRVLGFIASSQARQEALGYERKPRFVMAPSSWRFLRPRIGEQSPIVDSVRRVCAVFDLDGSRRKKRRSPDGASGNRGADLRGIVGIVSLCVRRNGSGRRRPTLWEWRSTGQ